VNKMRRAFLVFIPLLLLSGCMMGPDYQRPKVDMPALFRYEPQEAAEMANSTWWNQFNDPILDQLIIEALIQNKNVKAAAANIERAAGALLTSRAALFPQINVNAAGNRQYLSKNTAVPASDPNPLNNFQIQGSASWEIDLWGRIRRLAEAARANLLAGVEARRGVILSLVAEVAVSYIQLRALDEQLVIAKSTLKAYDESVKLFELQFKYGQISQIVVEQARTQYQTAAVTIPQIETQITQTENALSILLGRNPGPIPRGKPVIELVMPQIPAGLPSQLLERRPDILKAEQSLIAANAQIGAAKALYFPTISLTAAAGAASEALSNLFLGPSNTWNYAGSIVGPIFSAGTITGQVKQAEANQKAVLFAYEQAIQNAFVDMENALATYRNLRAQLAAEEKRVAAYKAYVRLAWLQYQGGYTTYLTVLTAQQQLFPAELSTAQARAALFIALANIYKAMGGGWVMEADKKSGWNISQLRNHVLF
jgi:multidrug efflux system outer membrane protein